MDRPWVHECDFCGRDATTHTAHNHACDEHMDDLAALLDKREERAAESSKRARAIVEKKARRDWLASLHMKFVQQELDRQALQEAPPEVMHRRVSGEMVFNRRLRSRR